MTWKTILTLVSLCGMATQLTAADQTASAEDLNQLREQIAKQQKEIDGLQQSLQAERELLERLIQKLGGTPAVSSSPVKLDPVASVAHANLAASGGTGQKSIETSPPLAIHAGDTSLTPFGFVDFTWYGRSTNVGSGIGTSFGGVPYSSSIAGHAFENNFSTQNSRLGLRVDSTVFGAKVLGYFEADFLGNPPGNIFVTANSATFRMRNMFVDVQKGSLELLGGQDWSLFTPNRSGLSPLPSDIFYSQNMDTNYQVGLVWARQSQFRLIAHPNNRLAFGVSLENPQQYVGSGSVTFPSALSSAAAAQFNNTATTYAAPNLHPDIIFKAAYDAHPGDKTWHVEAGALIRSFKFENAAGPTSTAFTSSTTTAVSGEANASLELAKNVRVIANTFFGSGGGRYIFGLGPDVILRPNGALSAVHAYSSVDGFETNLTKNTLVSLLYGGAYFGRNTAVDSNGNLIGYGFAGSAANNNRTVQEATLNVVRTFWRNRNYGALSFIGQYSYLWRNPWFVAPGAARYAKTNLIYLDLRYTLP